MLMRPFTTGAVRVVVSLKTFDHLIFLIFNTFGPNYLYFSFLLFHLGVRRHFINLVAIFDDLHVAQNYSITLVQTEHTQVVICWDVTKILYCRDNDIDGTTPIPDWPRSS